MKTGFNLLLALTAILLTGCAHTYKQSELRSLGAPLDPTRNVLISVPEDGSYEDIHYDSSGRMAANAVRAAFARIVPQADITDSCRGIDCLENIDPHSYGYFAVPEILSWEDRATEWSGRPDRVEIQLTVYDTTSKAEIASSMYSGKSKWATFGGDHPQDLLAEPTQSYVDSLYGQENDAD